MSQNNTIGSGLFSDYPAPWSDAQVENLRRRQARKDLHPYTGCSPRGGPGAKPNVLIPTTDGWVCPCGCGFRQKSAMWIDVERGGPTPTTLD